MRLLKSLNYFNNGVLTHFSFFRFLVSLCHVTDFGLSFGLDSKRWTSLVHYEMEGKRVHLDFKEDSRKEKDEGINIRSRF